jgi:Spy/CpxP family protein refolding chaperone
LRFQEQNIPKLNKEVGTMGKSKLTISTIAVITALVLASGWAFAHGSWGKKGDGYSGSCYGDYSNLPKEQREKLEAQEQKFYEDTSELRRNIYQKRLELQGLWVDPKTDPEKIRAKERETFGLQQQLREKALEYRLATRELLPEGDFGHGPMGYGHHMGRGAGMGSGHMRGGGHMWGF